MANFRPQLVLGTLLYLLCSRVVHAICAVGWLLWGVWCSFNILYFTCYAYFVLGFHTRGAGGLPFRCARRVSMFFRVGSGHPETRVQISRRLFFWFSTNRPTSVSGLKTVKLAMWGHSTPPCEILRCKCYSMAYPIRLAAAGIRPGVWGVRQRYGL